MRPRCSFWTDYCWLLIKVSAFKGAAAALAATFVKQTEFVGSIISIFSIRQRWPCCGLRGLENSSYRIHSLFFNPPLIRQTYRPCSASQFLRSWLKKKSTSMITRGFRWFRSASGTKFNCFCPDMTTFSIIHATNFNVIDYVISGGGGRGLYRFNNIHANVLINRGFLIQYFGYVYGFTDLEFSVDRFYVPHIDRQ